MLSILMTAFQQDDGGAAAAGLGSAFCSFVIAIVMIAGLWKLFTKAGQPGWAAIIPIYNTYILLKMAGKPGWWLLLLFIPIVNFVILILTMIDLAKAFGKGTGFALGLIFLSPIFLLILAFGDAKYVGIEGAPRPLMA